MKSTPFSIWYCRRAFFAVATILSSSTYAPSAPVLSVPIIPAFYFKGMPNTAYFNSLGMKHIPYCIDRHLFGTGLPDQASVNSYMAKFTALDPAPIVCFDIETLPVDIRKASTTQVDSTIAYFKKLINWVRSANPNAKVGFYGVPPIADYWTPNLYYTALRYPNDPWWKAKLPEFQKRYQAWLAANAYLAPLAQQVDYLFPSLYTFYKTYENPASDGWPTYAFSNIAEARKYRKPVYPFLWPRFHNDYSSLPNNFWEKELQYVRYYGDGMVIWGYGPYYNETWNPNAPWWLSVLALAKSVSGTVAGGGIGLMATPPDGVYSSAQTVRLVAPSSATIRYALTTNWPNGTWPTCSTGAVYTGPISVATSKTIQAIACYAGGSALTQSFAYVIK